MGNIKMVKITKSWPFAGADDEEIIPFEDGMSLEEIEQDTYNDMTADISASAEIVYQCEYCDNELEEGESCDCQQTAEEEENEICSYCGFNHGGVEIEYCNSGEHCDVCCHNYPECDEENDGQPDEMKEWEDYDPDC